ncbi:MAG: T9SS type A sorting domain-containing protein [Bacteroidales bacterium]|nr:T9SS type A sorting domain-containing protein [Bacteroidales bacterium]
MNLFYLKKVRITLLILFLVLLMTPAIRAQGWMKNLPQQKSRTQLTLTDYQRAFNIYWKEESKKASVRFKESGQEVRDENYEKYKRWEWYWETRVHPKTGAFPTQTAYDVYNEYVAAHPKSQQITSFPWTTIGPDQTPGGYAGLGRVNCVGFSPGDTNTLYVGSASGGVWKTTDLGAHWIPTGDFNEVLGVSDILVVNHGGDDIVYLATGDKDHYDTRSVGVLKSTDGGMTWNKTGLTASASMGLIIYKLMLAPYDDNILFAATNAGLYKSTNGATNWSKLSSHIFRNIEFKPGSTTRMYGSTYTGEIYYSTNGGSTWTQVLSVTGGGRTEIAVTPDSSNVVYAIMSNSSDDGLKGFYKSIDSGTNYTEIPDSLNLLGWDCDGGDAGGQGWYDLTLAVDPYNAQKVYIGGVNNWGTTDGGKSWEIVNHWSSTCSGKVDIVHADKHRLIFQNTTNALFECNDGGIYKSDNGKDWTNIGSGLVISQMYRLGTSKTVAGEVITGLQDNGTKLLSRGVWGDVLGGDGMECAIDYTNDSIQYGELPNGSIRRTTDRWRSSVKITTGLTGSGYWDTPFVMDPVDHKTLYIGYQDVFKTTNQGNSWTKLSSFGSTNTLRSLAVAPSNNKYLYAASLSNLYQSTDGGSTWTDITGSLPVNNASITYIAVKNDDPKTVWVTLGGFNNFGVYETVNGGISWNDISDGLPAIPIDCIVQNKLKTDTTQLYVGTDVGVYVKQGNSLWTHYSTDLPNVIVDEMEIRYDNSGSGLLYAATFGRGLWQADLFQGYLAPAIVADFTADNTEPLAVTDSVQFTDKSTNNPTAWLWHFEPANITYANGTDSLSQNPVVRFNQQGYYSVTLTASGPDSTVTKTIPSYIKVASNFSVTITANRTEICNGGTDTTQLFATPMGGTGSYSYSWSSVPYGFSSTEQNPVVQPKKDTTVYRCDVLDGTVTAFDTLTIYRVNCTGIDNPEAQTGKINLYPNPNSGRFTIGAEKNIRSVEVIDEAGQVIYRQAINGKKATLDLQTAKGIYFLKLTLDSDNGTTVTAVRKLLIR